VLAASQAVVLAAGGRGTAAKEARVSTHAPWLCTDARGHCMECEACAYFIVFVDLTRLGHARLGLALPRILICGSGPFRF